MGTGVTSERGAYKNASDNLSRVSSIYKYHNGYFGERGNKNFIRVISCTFPNKSASEFFSIISEGGAITKSSNGKAVIATMADGTVISYRTITKTLNSPAVEINIRYSSNSGSLKYQKIHFVEKK